MGSDETDRQAPIGGEARNLTTSKARILVIDDDEMVLATISAILKRDGYEVLEATNGNEGHRHLRGRAIDLVITDILMPHKDGIEIILELRRKFPGLKIIAISGGGQIGERDYLKMAIQFGAFDVLSKPMMPATILESVNKALTK